MKCKAEGCDREARYKAACLCQKHYFRMMRNGVLNIVRKPRRAFLQNPDGYIKVFDKDCPLSDRLGYVYEHRKVMFDAYGYDLPNCEICGSPTNWGTCHIDHIDEDVTNNNKENLRPLCSGCNTSRNYPEQCSINNRVRIEFNGEIKTAAEWARDERVKISGRQILERKRKGMSDFDALFSRKKTHNKQEKQGE